MWTMSLACLRQPQLDECSLKMYNGNFLSVTILARHCTLCIQPFFTDTIYNKFRGPFSKTPQLRQLKTKSFLGYREMHQLYFLSFDDHLEFQHLSRSIFCETFCRFPSFFFCVFGFRLVAWQRRRRGRERRSCGFSPKILSSTSERFQIRLKLNN